MVNKKRYFLTLILIAITMVMITLIPCYSNASINPNDYDPGKYTTNSSISDASGTIVGKANAIIGIIKTVGVILSVLILVVLGIKFMTGSVSEKAEYKKTMIPYLIGAVMIFAIPQLVQIIFDITTSTLN